MQYSILWTFTSHLYFRIPPLLQIMIFLNGPQTNFFLGYILRRFTFFLFFIIVVLRKLSCKMSVFSYLCEKRGFAHGKLEDFWYVVYLGLYTLQICKFSDLRYFFKYSGLIFLIFRAINVTFLRVSIVAYGWTVYFLTPSFTTKG